MAANQPDRKRAEKKQGEQRDGRRLRYQKSHNEANPGGEPPAGNAIYDPANQSHRLDLPEEEQTAQGQDQRGSLPSQAPIRSNQPERADHRSNQPEGVEPE